MVRSAMTKEVWRTLFALLFAPDAAVATQPRTSQCFTLYRIPKPVIFPCLHDCATNRFFPVSAVTIFSRFVLSRKTQLESSLTVSSKHCNLEPLMLISPTKFVIVVAVSMIRLLSERSA